MKLVDAAKYYLKEVDDEDKGKVPPSSGSSTISTKQAANELGVTVSRVRQMIGDQKLDPEIKPRSGDRDHELRKKDVDAMKSKRGKGIEGKKGRPSKSKKKDD